MSEISHNNLLALVASKEDAIMEVPAGLDQDSIFLEKHTPGEELNYLQGSMAC